MDLIKVYAGDREKTVPSGTTLFRIAEEDASREKYPILLARVDGRLRELRRPVTKPCQIEWVSAADPDGYRACERSLQMLLGKAVRDLYPEGHLDLVSEFSVNGGIYLRINGDFPLDESFEEAVSQRMRELVEKNIPFRKESMHLDTAIALFRELGMKEKVKLFRYRRSSWVNVYFLEDYADYYYGYMVPSTGCLGAFSLELYERGLVLRLPDRKDPSRAAVFHRQPKLFQVMQDGEDWGSRMRLNTVGDVDDWISAQRGEELVLIAEARQEEKIAAIAKEIAGRKDVKFVMIAGPSASGKTSFSHRLSIQLRAYGLNPHPIEVDNYFVNRDRTPRDENGNYDFEALECVDIAQFNEDMLALLAGKEVPLPSFDFIEGRRRYEGETLQLGANDILVIEGIHCLNDRLSSQLPQESRFRIYVSALTPLNIDEHNRIPTTDLRLIRRMLRDARTRGYSAKATIDRWPSVRRGEEKNIFPFQESADAMFDSSLIYEFPVMKTCAEQLLYGISPDEPEYAEAKRLLKFFDYFLAIDADAVPRNSLIKEFIGGSIFRV